MVNLDKYQGVIKYIMLSHILCIMANFFIIIGVSVIFEQGNKESLCIDNLLYAVMMVPISLSISTLIMYCVCISSIDYMTKSIIDNLLDINSFGNIKQRHNMRLLLVFAIIIASFSISSFTLYYQNCVSIIIYSVFMVIPIMVVMSIMNAIEYALFELIESDLECDIIDPHDVVVVVDQVVN